MICQCLVYIKVIHLYIYILYTHTHIDNTHTLFFIFFSIMVYYKILMIVLCAVQHDLVIYPFSIEWFASANSKLSIHSPHPTSPLVITSLFSVGEFVSV